MILLNPKHILCRLRQAQADNRCLQIIIFFIILLQFNET